MTSNYLDTVPLVVLIPTTLALTLGAVELGFRMGRARRRRGGESSGPIGATVGATLGLLAFILAFTFGIASSRHDSRKQLVLDDANAIGTCYLRTDLLAESQRAPARALLREYVALRAEVGTTITEEALSAALARSKGIHGELWTLAALASETNPSPVTALFVASCNDVFDIHEQRVTVGLENRIPGAVWILLYAVTLVAMLAVGYQAGLPDDRRSVGSVFLTMCFSMVIVLIADLDNPRGSIMKVSQLPIQKLQAELSPN